MTAMKGISLRQEWHCPSCNVQVVTYVTTPAPPYHPCPKKAGRITNLQQKKEETNE